jgi:serpin B
MNKWIEQMLRLAIVLILVILMVGCAGTAKGALLQSDKPRLTSDATDAEMAELVAGNSAFAFDLYQVLREGNDNLFYSPYSISLALAMTYAGARGETEQQMADTLHLILSQDRLHPAFNGLDLELASRGEGAEGKDGEGFRLNIVNAIWGQEGYEFLPEFLDVLAENYGAGLRLLDFENAPEESRVTINDWVSDQTEGRIEDLIPKGTINTWTRLVLANAIYFDAAWLHPFKAERTHDGTFHLLDGGEVTVPMMAQTESFPYTEGEGYQTVELPYDGGELSMVILLPEAGQFEAFEGSLDAERVSSILKGVKPEDVRLTMPKFTFDSSFKLAETLSDMGMPDAFLYKVADFSGMDGTGELFIGEAIHKAFVDVDEAGTEAAAATAVVGPGAAPPPPIEVTVDRPFVFLIRDIETSAILFVGRVVNHPRSQPPTHTSMPPADPAAPLVQRDTARLAAPPPWRRPEPRPPATTTEQRSECFGGW